MAFWDDSHGVALGDPVNGQFQLIATDDGGANWKRSAAINLPPALPNEAFAASGTCFVTQGQQDVWFSTGGAKTARTFHSTDRGRNWTVADTPVLAGTESAGIFSIAFRDREHGMIVGGDYRKPNDDGPNAAITADSGKTWTSPQKTVRVLLGCRVGKRPLDRGRNVGFRFVSRQRRDLVGARPRELQQRRIHSDRYRLGAGPKDRIAKLAN